MKANRIVILLLICGLQLPARAQGGKSCWEGVKAEISLPFLFPYPIGAAIKGKKMFFETPHLEGYYGIGLQQTYITTKIDKTALPFMDMSLTNSGAYVLAEFDYFPFKSKHFFIELEPFMGITQFKTKSSIDLPGYQIVGDYTASYTFFNYGMTHGIGWQFDQLAVKADVIASYKGFFDKGRFRFGDFDTFLFPEISISWTFR